MPLRHVMITAGLLFMPPQAAVESQQMDMEAMMRWASVDVVRYHIVGVYQSQTYIASDGSGLGDVMDRVVIDLEALRIEAGRRADHSEHEVDGHESS